MRFGEFFVGCDGDVRRRAAALMGFVFGAEIDQYAIAILRECLDGFDCSEQRGVDVSFSEKFGQGGRGRCHEFHIVKQIDAIPVALQ